MKKTLFFLLIFALAASFSAFGRAPVEPPDEEETEMEAEEAAKPAIKNPDTYIHATHGTIDSLDPAKAYDSASWSIQRNLMDPLVAYDGTHLDKFLPMIAAEVPTTANGGISADGLTYRFKIRKNVKFHDGSILTPEDVEYTFERAMVTDPDGFCDWVWWFVFTGDYSSRDGDGNLTVNFSVIDKAIEVDGGDVVFTLKEPYEPFLAILAGAWGGILNKDFVVANGGWPGTAGTWKDYNDPAEGEETLYDIANGAGPFKLERWEKGDELVMLRHEDYWGPKPAMAKAIYKVVDEYTTRKLMLIQGDADSITVAPVHFEEMDKESGLKVYKDLASLNNYGWNINMKITTTDNPAVYSAKLDGEGIPGDFLTDKNLRLAFLACWDGETFLRDVMAGLSIDPITPIPKGMPYKNDALKNHEFDLKKAEELFKKAWDGQVWEKGFKMDFLYNSGNESRELGMKLLAENVMKVNPKFQITVRGVEWAEYVNANANRLMPIFFIGWGPDYPDPDNYVYPYMHSTGTYAGKQGYNNPEVDELIMKGAYATDPAARKDAYYKLQDIWLEDAIGMMTHQPLSRRYFRDWVKGWYFNPMISDEMDILRFYSKGY